MDRIDALRVRFDKDVEFAIVYIKEAHPGDEWQMSSNEEKNIVFNQPQTFNERLELAGAFVADMNVEIATYVDDIQNTAMACYAAWPERVYIIDTNGRIAYKDDMGPFGFNPDEVEEYLEDWFGLA